MATAAATANASWKDRARILNKFSWLWSGDKDSLLREQHGIDVSRSGSVASSSADAVPDPTPRAGNANSTALVEDPSEGAPVPSAAGSGLRPGDVLVIDVDPDGGARSARVVSLLADEPPPEKKKKRKNPERPEAAVRKSHGRLEYHPYIPVADLHPRKSKYRCEGKTIDCYCSDLDDLEQSAYWFEKFIKADPRMYSLGNSRMCPRLVYAMYAKIATKIREDWENHVAAGKEGWPWGYDATNEMVKWYKYLKRIFNIKNIFPPDTSKLYRRDFMQMDVDRWRWIERWLTDVARRHGAQL